MQNSKFEIKKSIEIRDKKLEIRDANIAKVHLYSIVLYSLSLFFVENNMWINFQQVICLISPDIHGFCDNYLSRISILASRISSFLSRISIFASRISKLNKKRNLHITMIDGDIVIYRVLCFVTLIYSSDKNRLNSNIRVIKYIRRYQLYLAEFENLMKSYHRWFRAIKHDENKIHIVWYRYLSANLWTNRAMGSACLNPVLLLGHKRR
jgi:hypothetical protein